MKVSLNRMKSLVVALTLVVSSASVSFAEPSEWALKPAYWMQTQEAAPDTFMVSNMNTQVMDRENLAEVLVHTYALANNVSVDLMEAGEPFTDTDSLYVAKAYQAGLLSGITETTFQPSKTVTRIEAIEAFEKLLKSKNITMTYTAVAPLTDYALIPAARRTTVNYLYELGVLGGWAEYSLSPSQEMSFEDALTLSYKVLTVHNWMTVPTEEAAIDQEVKEGFTVPKRTATDLIIFEPSDVNGIRILYSGLYFGAYGDKVEKSHRQLIAIGERYTPYKYMAVKSLSAQVEDAWDSVQKEYSFETDFYINGTTGSVSTTKTMSSNYIHIKAGNRLIIDFVK